VPIKTASTPRSGAALHLTAVSASVQRMAPPVAWTVLEALRPLGEKASHRYVSLLAAASELAALGQKTV